LKIGKNPVREFTDFAPVHRMKIGGSNEGFHPMGYKIFLISSIRKPQD
jgi:hypothetical protein